MTRNSEDVSVVKIKKKESAFTGKHTYTTVFMLPCYGVFLDRYLSEMCVNCYLDDMGHKHLFERPMFMLVRVKERDKVYSSIDSYLKQNVNFVYTYVVGKDDKGGHLYMYTFECPPKFSSDYDKFLEAKYSEMSPEFKKLHHRELPYGGRYIENPAYSVLFKTPAIKQTVENILNEETSKYPKIYDLTTLDPSQEYFGAIDKSLEIFRI